MRPASLVFVLLFLVSCPVYSLLPTCCSDRQHYADILLALRCTLICRSDMQLVGDFCSSCSWATVSNQDLNYTSESFAFSKPVITCQNLMVENKTTFGYVVLTWPFSKAVGISSAFLIESKISKPDGKWHFVGMTNETVAEIHNLEVGSVYQFRISPLMISNLALHPEVSEWIYIANARSIISAPSYVRTSSFYLDENFVNAIVEWSSSKDMPCSYKVSWFLDAGGEIFEQVITVKPKKKLSAVLRGLAFGTNYTVKVTPFEPSDLQKSESSQEWFVTPSCLQLLMGNFNFCAPGPPLNVNVEWIPFRFEAVLTWKPPNYTSSENQVSSYDIYVAESPEKIDSVTLYRYHFSVNKNSSNATVPHVLPSATYVFEIRAISIGGTGPAAVVMLKTSMATELHIRETSPLTLWIYIFPSSLVGIMIIAAIVVFCIWQYRKSLRKAGYPSGSADVSIHLLPLLIPSSKILLQDVLGHGAFSVVHKGIYIRKKAKETVAVKVFPSETVSRNKLLHEVELLSLIGRHQHIVGLVGFTLDIDKMYLLLEYCKLGDLHSKLVKMKEELLSLKTLPKNGQNFCTFSGKRNEHYGVKLSSYIYQVAVGMEYIASLKMIHRDIASRNVLLCSENHVKIADFGLSKDVYETRNYSGTKQSKLPIRWMAPESIEKQIFNTYTDVWSFGVLIWEIFKFGKIPYEGLKSFEILPYLKFGNRLAKPGSTTQDWYNIMCSCWHMEPKQRPSFRELVQKTGNILCNLCHYTVLVNE